LRIFLAFCCFGAFCFFTVDVALFPHENVATLLLRPDNALRRSGA